MTNDIINSLIQARPVICDYSKLYARAEAIEQIEPDNYHSDKKRLVFLSIFIYFAVTIIADQVKGGKVFNVCCMLLAAALEAAFIALTVTMHKRRLAKAARLRNEAEALAYENAELLSVIPRGYYFPEAVDYIINLF